MYRFSGKFRTEQTERQTDRETDRQRDRQTERQTDRQRFRGPSLLPAIYRFSGKFRSKQTDRQTASLLQYINQSIKSIHLFHQANLQVFR
jgi:hypothetical protein